MVNEDIISNETHDGLSDILSVRAPGAIPTSAHF